jgi:hypothetical protein
VSASSHRFCPPNERRNIATDDEPAEFAATFIFVFKSAAKADGANNSS